MSTLYWTLAFVGVVALAVALNSMLVLAVAVGPLLAWHAVLTIRETRP